MQFVPALTVYISILEQQAKYGNALEMLSGELGSLLMIEVDKLRVQVLSEAFIFLSLYFKKSLTLPSMAMYIHAYMHYTYVCVYTHV